MTQPVYLIDGSGYIFRAYHALPPLTRSRDNLPIGAVAGFCNMLWRLLADLKSKQNIVEIGVIFDQGRRNFRHDIYPDYKANRPSPPEDLIPQFALVRRAVQAFGLSAIEAEGWEADDLLASYAADLKAQGRQVIIVTADKDMMQLVDDNVTLLEPIKNKSIGYHEVIEKFGVPPELVAQLQALTGDSVDNIPGVPSIGIKTAAQLLQTYGSLQGIYDNMADIKASKRKDMLIAHQDKAFLSWQLTKLADNAPLPCPVENLGFCDFVWPELVGFLKAMEFKTLLGRLARDYHVDIASFEPCADLLPAPSMPVDKESTDNHDIKKHDLWPLAYDFTDAYRQNISHDTYELVTTQAQLDEWIDFLSEQTAFALDLETTGLNVRQAEIVGIALAHQNSKACYIPVGHNWLLDTQSQCDLQTVLDKLKPLLLKRAIRKIGHNLKYDSHILERYGLVIHNIDDSMLMSVALGGGKQGHGLDALAKSFFDYEMVPFKSLVGGKTGCKTFADVGVEDALRYAAEDADITFRLWQCLQQNIIRQRQNFLYYEIERPMVSVTRRIEQKGLQLDVPLLGRLSTELSQNAQTIAERIYQQAGEEFLISSPKQLGHILFDKLGIQSGEKHKKTASGQYATGSEILEELAIHGHQIANDVLEWRQLEKLRNTYTEALPKHVDSVTGRIYTDFNLAGAITGRLSSLEPNLQNIPVRSSWGQKIRQAFIASPGHKLVCADYSQIELRILTVIAGIDSMQSVFTAGGDVHALTASQVFQTPLAEVTAELRRRAKAINFGIIYGISAFGLAAQLQIPRSTAQSYIEQYYLQYPGIRRYREQVWQQVQEQGYVETIFGRRIWIDGITGRQAAFAKRLAMNGPIQGSAADIIKRAMIAIDKFISEQFPNVKICLQVHDELMFEVPDDHVTSFMKALPDVMVGQGENPIIPALSVPLSVSVQAGNNWHEAH